MEAFLRRTQQGTGGPAREVPAAAGPGGRGHRRGPELQDSAAQPERDMRRSRQLPARRGVPSVPRLPDGRQHRRLEVQRRAARRRGPRTCQDREARQQDAGHHRDSFWQDHRHGEQAKHVHRQHPEGSREGEDQGAQGGGHDGSQRGDSHPPDARSIERQDHRRAVCLYRLRGQHLAQLLRHRRPQALFPHRERGAQAKCRYHAGAAQEGAPHPQGRADGEPALRLAGAYLHRGAHLQGPSVRECQVDGRGLSVDRRTPNPMVPQDDTRGDEGRHPAPDGNQDGPHPEVQQGQGRRAHRPHQGGDRADRPRAEQHGGGDQRLVPLHQGEIRQGPSAPDRDKELRHHHGSQGGRSQPEAVREPRGGLHRHLAEEGRVREQLFGHRRRHPLLQGRHV